MLGTECSSLGQTIRKNKIAEFNFVSRLDVCKTIFYFSFNIYILSLDLKHNTCYQICVVKLEKS